MKIKFLSAIAFLLFMISSASAATAEVKDASGVPPIEGASFEIFGLQSSTSYQLAAKTSSGRTNIDSFTTNGAGNGKLTVTLQPSQRGTVLSDQGYRYQIVKDGNVVDDVFTVYGSTVFEQDNFVDGVIAYDNFDQIPSNAVEDGNSQILQSGSNQGVGNNENITFTFSSDKTLILDSGSDGFADYYIQDFSNQLTPYSACGTTGNYDTTFRIYYNQTGPEFVFEGIEGFCDGQTFTFSAPSNVDNLTVFLQHSGSQRFDINEFYIAPENSRELWYANPDALNLTLPTVYSFEDVRRFGNTGADLRYSDQGSTFTAFAQDLELSDKFYSININNETVEPYEFDLDRASPFTNLQPADGTGTTTDTLNVTYTHSEYPPNEPKDSGEVGLQFFINSQWQTVSSDIITDCKFFVDNRDFHSIDNGDCTGEEITLSKDISNYEGDIEWRLKYQDDFDLTGDFPTAFSEERTFTRIVDDPEFALNLPQNQTTITTLKPTFNFNAQVFQSGELQLELKESASNTWNDLESWTIGNSANRQFSFTPTAGLQEKDYNWRVQFKANSGKVVNSAESDFTINTSKAGDTNVTLIDPSNNQLLKKTDLNLTYQLNTSQPVTSEVFLDGNSLGTRSVSAGDNLLRKPLLSLSPDTYYWYIVANNSNTYYQSDVRRFQISEDVSIDLVSPEENAEIERPPIIFRTNLTSEVSGTLQLFVDGNRRDQIKVPSSTNRTYELEVDSNITQGGHSWNVKFVSDNSDQEYRSSSRRFDLNVGIQDGSIQDTGEIGDSIASSGSSIFGLARGESLSFFSVMFSALVAIFVGMKTHSGEVAGLSAVLILSGFTIIGWFPSWLTITMAVLAAATLASKASSGNIP